MVVCVCVCGCVCVCVFYCEYPYLYLLLGPRQGRRHPGPASFVFAGPLLQVCLGGGGGGVCVGVCVCFIVSIHTFTSYWARDKDADIPALPLLSSLGRCFRCAWVVVVVVFVCVCVCVLL